MSRDWLLVCLLDLSGSGLNDPTLALVQVPKSVKAVGGAEALADHIRLLPSGHARKSDMRSFPDLVYIILPGSVLSARRCLEVGKQFPARASQSCDQHTRSASKAEDFGEYLQTGPATRALSSIAPLIRLVVNPPIAVTWRTMPVRNPSSDVGEICMTKGVISET